MSKCTRINELVEILDRPCVLNCRLNPFVKPAFKLWTLFYFKMQNTKVRNDSQYKRKKRRKWAHLLRSKCTKQRGLLPAQQPRDVPPKVIKKSLPTVA